MLVLATKISRNFT